MSKKRFTKRANAVVAAIAIIAVSAASMIVLATLNTTKDFEEMIRDNMTEKYNRESFITLVMDHAIESILDAQTIEKPMTTCGECKNMLNHLQQQFAPSGYFEVVPADQLPENEGLPSEYVKLLKSVTYRKKDEASATCSMDGVLSLDNTIDESESLPDINKNIPLSPIVITAEANIKNNTYWRTWQIEGAYLHIDVTAGGYVGVIRMNDAVFSILESNI